MSGFQRIMTNIKLWLIALLSGSLMALAWPAVGGISSLIYISFIGLLLIEKELSKKSGKGLQVFGYAYLSFFIFNLLTTWWIYYASDWGAAAAVICNSLFMAIVFWLFHQTKVKVGEKEGYIGLLIYWIAFEYLHLNWDLSWPWLTLGNVFAQDPSLVQWYEYTGVLGGSALILIINLLLFFALGALVNQRKKASALLFAFSLVILFGLTFFSKQLYKHYNAEGKALEVLIVQPNIDPYFDKFGGMSEEEQIDRMITLAEAEVDETTDLILFPETAFPGAYWEHEVENFYGTKAMLSLLEKAPNARIIVGLSSRKLITDLQKVKPTSKRINDKAYYDFYNTAMQLNMADSIAFHRKSKLVLGVEKVPFLSTLPFMKKLSINLGGSAGGFGSQDHPNVFFKPFSEEGIGPIICYESIYGEYVNQYALSGAELYAIITNDGWWDDTPGYKQHLAYARLRAIEGRRSIVRSANTGISAIIDQKGDVIQQTNWWEADAIKGTVKLNNSLTFYVKYGNYIGRTAAFVAPLLLLLTIVKKLNKTERRLKARKP